MERNSLKNEVIRAQDILKQIQMRFTAEYQLNSNILTEIRSYKEKLKCMEDERTQSLVEIEKNLSIITKTNEELHQRLVIEDGWLRDAEDDITPNNLETEEHNQQEERICVRSLADFTNAFTLRMNEETPIGTNGTSTTNVSNLETYLQDLYEELCTRVQAQQNEMNPKGPDTELEEIKALLNEGEKRLQSLSAKNEGSWTKDVAATMALSEDQKTKGIGRDGWLNTSRVPLLMSSPNPQNEDDQNLKASVNYRPLVQEGWVNTPKTSTKPAQDPSRDSYDDSCKTPLVNSTEVPEESQKIPSPTPRPVGPVRASTYPADQTDMTAPHLGVRPLGKGKDYFEEMFQNADDYFNLSHDYRTGRSHVPKTTTPPLFNGYDATTSSAVGNLCILEINEEGKFVRLYNANRKEMEIGNYMVKQNVGGHPVIVFRFPPRTKFPQNSIITIWTASCDNDVFHDPPSNYIWDAQVKWGVGPEFTTILCKPNGQAIAWTNIAHRFNPQLSPRVPMTPIHIRTMQRSPAASAIETRSCSRNDVALDVRNSSHTWDKNLVFLKRGKQTVIPVSYIKHPHGLSPGSPAHPCGRRQIDSRWATGNASSNPCTPEPKKNSRKIFTKRCSNTNESLTVSQPTICTNSQNRNNYKKTEFDLLSCVAFMKPSTRLQYGLELIRAQYNMTYNPPMPKLSRATW